MHRRWYLELMSHNTSGHKASLIVLTFVYVKKSGVYPQILKSGLQYCHIFNGRGLHLGFGCIPCSYEYNMVFIDMLGRFLYIAWI
jgi:hypothetical protein